MTQGDIGRDSTRRVAESIRTNPTAVPQGHRPVGPAMSPGDNIRWVDAPVTTSDVRGEQLSASTTGSGASSRGSRGGKLYRGDPGVWSWVAHRITGVLTFFFLFA